MAVAVAVAVAAAACVWLFFSVRIWDIPHREPRTENVRFYCGTMSGKEKFSQMNMGESSGIYKLIEFIAKERCKGRSVDVVPCEWIVYDNEAGNLKTVFMPPPYTTETAELLHSLVKSRAEPPKSWPFYQINIVGDAKTYDLALSKLRRLEEKKYVYSTESDHGESRALSDIKKYKLKAIKTDRDVEKKLLRVPPLYSDDDTCSLLSETSKESESISNDEEKLHTKRCQKTYSRNTIKNVISKDKEKQSGTKSNKHKFEKMESVSRATKENKETKKTERNSIVSTSGQFEMSKGISKDMEKESRTLCKSNKQKLEKMEISSRAIKENTETEKTEKNPIVFKSGQLQMSKGQYTDGNTTSINTKHCVEKSSIYLFDERKQYTTNDLARLVTSGFRSVCSQLTQVTLNINELKNISSLEKSRQICTDIQFSEKYGMEFPCKTLANFMEFEENLKNKAFRQDFQLNLWKNIDTSTSLLKSLTNILKKYMSRDVAMAFTAVKKVDKKQLLKTTIFSSCIQKVVIEEYSTSNAHPPITDKMYYSTLGSILNNAKDWEGHRLMRQKKLNPTHTEEELEETMGGDDDAVYE